MPEESFYFDHGLTPHLAFAGEIVANLKALEQALKVKLTVRDCWVKIAGEDDARQRAVAFFQELTAMFLRRGRKMEQADFEQVLKAWRDGREDALHELYAERLVVGSRKNEIMPRSRMQMEYLRAMREKTVVFGIGPAGTGKTYLAMAMAVSEFLKGNCTRIILTRPAREAGEMLGFLPGNLEDKIMPYLRPLYDALYDLLDYEEAHQLMARGAIEVAPLAFMRGRTLNNSFIILDEAQNTTEDQMLMFLTRMGFHSRCVVTGDPMQNDLGRNERSGLLHAAATLPKVEEIAFCHFTTADVVRNALLEKIINAYSEK